jgi:acetoin utilization protein AcuB
VLVREVMIRNVVAIDPEMPIKDVTALMELRDIRHFPILEGDQDAARLVGIVSDRDLRTVGSPHPSARPDVTVNDPVRRIMVGPVETAHPEDAIEDAAHRLRERRVGVLPVVDGERLVGIVSARELLQALTAVTGPSEPSTVLEVEVSNRPGALAELLHGLASRRLNVSGVTTVRSDAEAVCVAIRIDSIDGPGVARDLLRAGWTVVWPDVGAEPAREPDGGSASTS